MIGRKKDSRSTSGSVRADSVANEATVTPEPQEEHHAPNYTAPKGKPTPSRKQQQQARRQPLVPADRKAAKEANRAALREQRMKENIAMQTGDEKHLPLKDKGPQRRYIRDYVDARFNVGDFMIIALLLIFVAGIFIQSIQLVTVTLMWIFIALLALDLWFMWRGLKKKLLAKFGQVEPGSTMYAINRAMMIRRIRLPKPQVKRGQYPS